MCRPTLHWDADHVSRLMECRNIRNRRALAKELRRHPSGVYRAFDEDWSGGVSLDILAAMSVRFNVPVGWLVRDPRGR
ncbi:hypothetical protein [Mycobacterium avium]|uniref:hypothetical protein n=1 Tax=Mycobacterium avium TaxID=1764 RepID=UPI000213AABF|nr:hypothetical protein [Mycobacterium avium]ETB12564.1 hypothetical protein O980_08765 [Mycobacterium avium subsp. paratuberculosis 08-8281]ETB40717.1 hypothetical protein O975_09865 [Mycobacterium avium subsp. paratuberculosis 11-1786]AZP80779.1 hypothetical protein EGA31_07170 [Mycobacterium avium subsp. paratuberculosis]QPM71163.1 hypothetical protein MAPS_09060 [Mycobacterium avium subsp. paratuberculosis S397]QQK50788.1 hypothetical protein CDQ89_13905 [Mycobacterium avium subsp. paratub